MATRNRLIHGYLGIDNDTLWSIIRDDVPPLLENLLQLKSLAPSPADFAMSLKLKTYQQEALDALARFFESSQGAVGAADEVALDAAFRRALLDQQVSSNDSALSIARLRHHALRLYSIFPAAAPTLLGAHAVAVAAAVHRRGKPLALWLTPTDIIRHQTLAALRTRPSVSRGAGAHSASIVFA